MVAIMLDAAGAGELPDSDARSLLPVIKGDQDAVREVAHSMIRLRPGLPTWIAVSDGNHRLTYDRDSGECVELFDITADPQENENLVESDLLASDRERLLDTSRITLG